MIGPVLLFGALRELAPRASGIGQMQPFQQGVEFLIGDHQCPPSASKGSAGLSRVQALRFAPPPRRGAPAAAWTRPPRGAACAVADGRSCVRWSPLEIDPPGCSRNDDRKGG